jgi:hypothetical protein
MTMYTHHAPLALEIHTGINMLDLLQHTVAVVRTSSVALAILCVIATLTPGTRAQDEFGCRAQSDEQPYWDACMPRSQSEQYPAFGSTVPREYATDLTDQDVLLFMTYGLGSRLAADIDATMWQNPSFSPDQHWLLTNRRAPQQTFALQWRTERFQDRRNRVHMMGYLETVLPVDQPLASSSCHDCEFTLALGMVWGYRWSTISGRMSTDTVSSDAADTDHSSNYGFQFLHDASPRWRYLLAVGREQDTLDVVGEALWRIRPDAYVSLTTGISDVNASAASNSDLKLYFSFK